MKRREVLRWWRAPFWLLALATSAKSFVDNPILGSRRLNQAGLHAMRVRVAHKLAGMRRRSLAAAVPAEWRNQFDRDGFVAIQDFLPAQQFERLRRQALEARHLSREHLQGDTITRRVPVCSELLDSNEDLRALIASPRWKGLLAYVASCRSEPLYYLQTIFGGAVSGPPDPQVQLHSDTFHPSLKSWFFLTDVDEDSCPVTYVAGSHRLTPERLAWERARSCTVRDSEDRLSQRGSLRISADELSALRLPPPTRIAVPANTLVVADTYGFHARGTCNHPTVRAEIWGYCRRSPFLPWSGFDLLSLPMIAERRAVAMAAILDWLDRSSWATQHWQPVGWRQPLEACLVAIPEDAHAETDSSRCFVARPTASGDSITSCRRELLIDP